jgi:hypothetical protein
MLGSLLVVIAYSSLKDLRKSFDVTNRIVLMLGVFDFFFSLGFFVMVAIGPKTVRIFVNSTSVTFKLVY